MRTTRSLALALVSVAALAGCPKKPGSSIPDGGALAAADASAPAVADAAVTTDSTDAAAVAPLSTTTATAVTTATTAHGCPAGQTGFLVDGKHACETQCNATKGSNNQCAEPTACLGVAPLAAADAGAALGEYCRTSPSGACSGANQAQFWNNNAGGRPTCETLCKAPNDTSCPSGMTCKGSAMLFLVNGKQGELHRFCKK